MQPKELYEMRENESGISLITTCLLVVVLSMFIVAGSHYYEIWESASSVNKTDGKIEQVQKALRQYASENGRYPCPAPLDAPIDSAEFGVEVSSDCTTGAYPGTFRATGRDSRMVRTGTVPTRTLNIDDKFMTDAFQTRLIYAVTEEYAAPAAPLEEDNGAITIIDGNGNNATSKPGNIVQIVYSMGGDSNGAYSMNGFQIETCTLGRKASENCDFDQNATFINTAHKSTNTDNLFVHQISYVPSNTVITCEDSNATATLPKNVAFLVDTSGSMTSGGQCPSSMGGSCSRMDVARWAMRRVMPARIFNNSQSEDAGATSMTGFVGHNTVYNVESNLGDIVFDDPNANGYTAPDQDTLSQQLEDKLQAMCPSGLTPLGIHLRALADRLGDGTESRPNKIMVISDGANTNGMDPVTAAHQIHNTYPNLQVDIVDVVGNPSLMQVSHITGGSYYATSNPDELLDALYHSTGTCASEAPPTPPADQPGCGSSGNWWQNN